MSQTKVQLINNVSGDSGFGTSSPDGILSIKDTTDTYFYLQNNTTGTGSGDGSRLGFTGASSILRIQNQEDSDIAFHANGTEHMRIKSDGKVGIGKSNPSYALEVETASGDAQIRLRTDGTDSGDDTVLRMQVAGTTQDNFIYFGDSGDSNVGQIRYNHQSDFMSLTTNATERMRINNTGHVMIRTTSTSPHNSNSANFNTDGYLTINHVNTESSGRAYLAFNYNAGEIGTVTQSGTSGVSYNTSSDYRLKENATAISDGITRLKTLKPYKFNFIGESRIVDGFFAHEVTAVPEAVTGTKDETQDILYTEEDTIPSGKKVGDIKETVPKYQGIDQSKLVPLLTAALQEEIAKREALETRVAALEAA
jgi:hypothetical protein